MTKLVYGVGTNDADYQVRQPRCPIYALWANMLKRCYYAAYKAEKPTYQDCFVCFSWHTFSNFRNWVLTQDWEDKCLDKDIIEAGNRCYGPDTCAFVPQELNKLLNRQKAQRGAYPCGVSFHARDRVYIAKVREVGKQRHLGTFNTPEEASTAFNEAKSKVVAEVAAATAHPHVKAGLYRISREIQLGLYYDSTI